MRVSTISDGTVEMGAVVRKHELKGANVVIPVIFIGEEGRGRTLGVLPVQLTPAQEKEFQANGQVRIEFAELGQTKAGKPKLFAKDSACSDNGIIAVLRTPIGFRGGNDHTGDRTQTFWTIRESFADIAREAGIPIQEKYLDKAKVLEYAAKLAAIRYPGENNIKEDCGFEYHLEFAPFPGTIINKGVIAEGTAGRMGSGDQLVAVIPKNVVFRTSYSGRRYGKPSAHYYKWNGDKVLAATWEEREQSDIF